MKVTTNEKGTLILEDVFNGIILKSRAGETLFVCMRDSGFEISYAGDRYDFKNGLLGAYAGKMSFCNVCESRMVPDEESDPRESKYYCPQCDT